jgi:AraC-like DNA-binding protein
MYNCATMKFLRLVASGARRVTTAFLSRHPPLFDDFERPRLVFTPNDHFLIYALRGHRDITHETFSYAVAPDSLRVHQKGRHYLIDTRQTYEEIAIAFSALPGDLLVDADPAEGDRLHLPLMNPMVGRPEARDWCRQILADAAASSLAQGIRRDALLHLLFAEIVSRGADAAPGRDPAVARVIQEIESGIARSPDLDALGALVHLSRRSLMRRFKADTGKSVRQFVLERRVELARKMLLSDPSLPLRALASQLGFFDEYHFGHVFKKVAGVSPKRFRGKVDAGKA